MIDEIKIFPLQTPWGIPIQGLYREGRSDASTLISCIVQDEYKLGQFGLKPGQVAIDLGAHIGAATLAMCSLGLKVYSVELLKDNIELLKKNLLLNKYSATVYHAAIDDIDSGRMVAAFKTAPIDSTGYVHEYIGCAMHHEDLNSIATDGDLEMVRPLSINKIFEDNKIEHCHFMKVDCEGGEWLGFSKMKSEYLDRTDIIYGELHAVKHKTIVEHGDLLEFMQDKFIDVTEEYEPLYSKPGLTTHFVYLNKNYRRS